MTGARLTTLEERRTLAELYPPEKRPSASCAARFGGYVCTRKKHTHGPHVAHNSRLEAVAIELETEAQS